MFPFVNDSFQHASNCCASRTSSGDEKSWKQMCLEFGDHEEKHKKARAEIDRYRRKHASGDNSLAAAMPFPFFRVTVQCFQAPQCFCAARMVCRTSKQRETAAGAAACCFTC